MNVSRHWTLALTVVAAFAWCSSPKCLADPTPKLAAVEAADGLKSSYIALAKARLKTLAPEGNEPAKISLENHLFALRNLILECEKLACADKELQLIAREYRAAGEALLESVQAIQELPRTPSMTAQMLDTLMLGALAQFNRALDRNSDYSAKEAKLLQAWKRLGFAVQRLQVNDRLMPRIAARVAGPPSPPNPNPSLLKIIFKEPRYTLASDRIRILNFSGQTLNNCTIVVQLTGIAGDTTENVHFQEEWKTGEGVTAFYYEGIKIPGVNPINQTTVHRVQKVTAQVFSDEFAFPVVELAYTKEQQRRDAIEEITAGFKPKSSYLPFAKGVVFDDPRSVFVSYEGLVIIPSVKVTVQAYLGSDRLFDSSAIHLQNWKPAVSHRIALPNHKSAEADRWDISFRFEDIDFETKASWHRKR